MTAPTPETMTPEQIAMIVGRVHFQHNHALCNCHEGAPDEDPTAYASPECKRSFDHGVARLNRQIANLAAAMTSVATQAKVEALREAAEWLDPDLGEVTYDEEPQVNRITSRCSDWLDARADAIENKENSNGNQQEV